MIGIVVDTVVFKRAVEEARRSTRHGGKGGNFLERRARSKRLAIVLDHSRSLDSEYENTCGKEAARQLVVLLQDLGALRRRQPVPIPEPARTHLRNNGFEGTVDRLVLRIALAHDNPDRLVCSDDSDFWDGHTTESIGDHGANICCIIESAGLTLWSHAELLAAIPE